MTLFFAQSGVEYSLSYTRSLNFLVSAFSHSSKSTLFTLWVYSVFLPLSMRILFASEPYSTRSACVQVKIVCKPEMRLTSFLRRGKSSSLITSSRIKTGYSPESSLKISTSASLIDSAAVRVCPCEAYPFASTPPMIKSKSSRCGPTVVNPSLKSFS